MGKSEGWKERRGWFWWRVLVLWPLLLYGLVVGFLMWASQALTYPGASMHARQRPGHDEYDREVEEAEGRGVRRWEGAGGRYLGYGWKAEAAKAHWLIFYGNGDHALQALGWAEALREASDGAVHTWVMEYPGYGPREGKPSETAVVEAAREAWEALPRDGLPRYVFGQSMGAAVACRLAGEHPGEIRGLLLANPYDRFLNVARHYLVRELWVFGHLVPLPAIVADRYENMEHLAGYAGRVAVVAGGGDVLTPPEMAERLLRAPRGPVRLWLQPGVGHWADLEDKAAWRELMGWVMGGAAVPPVSSSWSTKADL